MVHEQQETTPLAASAGATTPRESAVGAPPLQTPEPPGDEPPDAGSPPLESEMEPARNRSLAFVRELVETVLLTLVIFVAVRTLVVNFRVDGESMHPSLQNGEYLLVNKAVYFHFDLNAVRNLVPGQHHDGQDIVYLFHPPQRGDIIVFDPPVRSDKPYVKRVIALAGETVAIHDGKVFVNGEALNEPYIADVPHYPYPLGATGGGEFVVPPGMIFVLGDNRNNSSDSHVFGAVPLDSVIGKAFISYWPPDGVGLIPHERYVGANGGK